MASAFPLNLEQIREPSQAISWRTNPVYFCYISTQYVTTGTEPGPFYNIQAHIVDIGIPIMKMELPLWVDLPLHITMPWRSFHELMEWPIVSYYDTKHLLATSK